MLIYPEIDKVAVSLGPISIRWYGIMYLLGFLAAWWLLRRRALSERYGYSPRDVEDIIFFAFFGVILGGRIGYMLVYGTDQLLSDPLSLLRIWQGGMSFHGGLVGVLFAMWFFGKRRGRTFFEVTDFMAPAVPIGLGLGRIGNFINNELWGKPTDVPWGFKVGDEVLHPSQLYEAFLEGLVLFAVLWTFSGRHPPRMAVSGMFLLLYGVFRIMVEFVRVPDQPPGYLAGDWLTMGQVLSTPMVLFGLLLLYLAYTRKKVRVTA